MVNDEVVEFNKKPQPAFKNPVFQQKFRSTSTTGKKRTWRSLKQVLAQERTLPWPVEVVHCTSSFEPCFLFIALSMHHQVSDRRKSIQIFLDYPHDIQIHRLNYTMQPQKNLQQSEVYQWI